VLWDPAAGGRLDRRLTGHTERVTGLAFSPDGRTLASASDDDSIVLWDPARVVPRGEPLRDDTVTVSTAVAFAPDDRTLAVAGYDAAITLWDTARHVVTGRLVAPGRQVPQRLAFAPDGRTLAAGDLHGGVVFWDVPRRALVAGPFPGPPANGVRNGIVGLAYGAGGTLVSAGADGTLTWWDARHRVSARVHRPAVVGGMATGPRGTAMALAGGGLDGGVTFWDGAARGPVTAPLAGHAGPVNAVVLSPDGRTFASGGDDGRVVLWDAAARTRLSPPLTGHRREVLTLAFSADGRTLASAGDDRAVVLWDVDPASWERRLCGLVGTGLTAAQWREYAPDVPPARTCG
ncbi:PD40 domain-containing protein, partial [Nonomuraea sp. RK-328]|nr:PD40 domain-containing protein [Nonomuraea sp. RK-328]